MENKNYLEDLKEIKEMMNKSTRFISLSGLSGILAGVYALIGAFFVHYIIENNNYIYITLESSSFRMIIFIAFMVLFLSVGTATLLTFLKAKKIGEKLFNHASRNMAINFLIPLTTGGIFSILLLKNGIYGLIAPITLIFYGLACINASKYTFRDVRYLGITEIILGLIAVEYSGFGLYFWVIGFGICHIFYGTMMWFKYERNN